MKRRAFTVLLTIAALLSSCGRNIAEAPLSAFDFSDTDVVAQILHELPKEQRGAFATFTVHHLATSKVFCGDILIDKNGKEPVTIGDAIRLTVAREQERARKPVIVDPATLSPVVRYRLALNKEQQALEDLVDRREMLLMIGTGSPRETAQLKELKKLISASSERLKKLRDSAPEVA